MAQVLVMSVQGGFSGIFRMMNDVNDLSNGSCLMLFFPTWNWNHLGGKKVPGKFHGYCKSILPTLA